MASVTGLYQKAKYRLFNLADRGFTKYRMRPLAAAVEQYYLRNVPVRLACGVELRVDGRHKQWRKYVDAGLHELDIEQFMTRYLRPGDTFVDVGANVGLLSVLGAKLVGPDGRVYAFEPQKEYVEVFWRAVELNGLTNVHLDGAALSDTLGEARFFKPALAVEAYMVPERGGPQAAATDLLTVASGQWEGSAYTEFQATTVPFDAWAAEHGVDRVDLVKIDVDGPEMRILRGMREMLGGEHPPALIVEVTAHHLDHGVAYEELHDFLTGYGYEIWATPRHGMEFTHVKTPDDLPIDQARDLSGANTFCYHPGHHGDRWAGALVGDAPAPR